MSIDENTLDIIENNLKDINDVLLFNTYSTFNKENKTGKFNNYKLVLIGGKAIEKMIDLENMKFEYESFDWVVTSCIKLDIS